ncbi:hypothetical protein ABMA27_010335 [Loxostege sticticalis]|uniref:ATP-dependent DNA helicase n=1 Tax=Loxostege sticticalis TaxID=481309 RepID=A0ABR3H5D8_LOXSC
MAHRKAVEAVDRTLRDIRQNDQPMGGVTMLFCGDFRQTLPVVPRGTKADEIRACLKSSSLWRHIKRVHLTDTMRVRTGGNTNAQEFSDLLLKIGEGTNLCHIVHSVEELIASVYGDQRQMTNCENSWLCERAVLTPRNDQAARINLDMLANVEGELVEYTSINRVIEQDYAINYPVEFLDSLSAPGLLSHKISLKNGSLLFLYEI